MKAAGYGCRVSKTAVSIPVALSIAGSDCSAGAGVQADLKTFTALGCYGMTALTSVVAETPLVVSLVQLMDGKMVEEQVSLLLEAYPVKAVKTGMLGGREQIAGVVRAWTKFGADTPLVVDPVMVATSGGRLLEDDAVEEMTERLFPFATLITPNLDEAAVLLGRTIKKREEMPEAARTLVEKYGCAVLLKGGHLEGSAVPDLLMTKEAADWLEGVRIENVHTHGTGCTFSAAITSGLAHGLPLLEAVKQGKTYVTNAIANYYRWGGLDALNHSV